MQFYVVIVAGGSGKRMGAEIPKQFLELAGRPVLMHTIERFKSFNDSVEIITVLPEDQLRHWIELKEKYSFNVPETLVKGGSHRFDSVKNGLQFVNVPGVVAIHDGVRPFVSIETIKRCFETAEKLGNAIPSISITESLRMISDKGSNPINRLLVRHQSGCATVGNQAMPSACMSTRHQKATPCSRHSSAADWNACIRVMKSDSARP